MMYYYVREISDSMNLHTKVKSGSSVYKTADYVWRRVTRNVGNVIADNMQSPPR